MGLTTRKNYRLMVYGNTLLIVFLGAVSAGCLLFWLLPTDLGDSYGAIMATAGAIRKVLTWRVAALYAVTSFFIILGIAVIHLFYSHRIAGPAYRLGKEAARIARGNLLGNISFRRKDNLTDMADLLNGLMSQYRCRINTAKECLALIEKHSRTAAALMREGGGEDDLKQTAEAIKINVDIVERCLAELRS